MGNTLRQARRPVPSAGSARCRSHVVVEYAAAWLAVHHEMPTGIHRAHTVKPHPMGFRDLPTLTVDFTLLHGLRERLTPEQIEEQATEMAITGLEEVAAKLGFQPDEYGIFSEEAADAVLAHFRDLADAGVNTQVLNEPAPGIA